ncbi:MAG: hypothetical protein U0103_24090, partial [Candidatus Obscuribacterales bacterium]
MNKFKRAQEEEYTRRSLQQFYAIYPNEEACLRVFPADCKGCGAFNEEAFRLNKRDFDCSNCNKRTWRTAGTFFHGLHYLHPTFALIWLHDSRAVISKNRLSKIFEIAYATAWETAARLESLFEEEMAKGDAFEVATTVFDRVICKRSNLCAGGQHPDYLEENNQPDEDVLEQLNEDQLSVIAFLKAKPIGFDSLYSSCGLPISKFSAALGSLVLMGIAKQQFGSRYSLVKKNSMHQISEHEKSIIEVFFDYVRNFHGISRRYLQRYLAKFWARYWPIRWSEPTLLECCMKHCALSRMNRFGYNSPPLVRLPEP